MNHRMLATFATLVLLSLLTACGNGGGGGGSSGGTPPPAIASIAVEPATWEANRIGQRQQFTATALDASGNPVPDVAFTWTSTAIGVAPVDAGGNVTAQAAGTAIVTATAGNQSATSSLTVTSEVPSAAGDMYTVWFARSDDAPALLVGGQLVVAKDMYCLLTATRKWRVCPTPLDGTVYVPPVPITPWEKPNVAKFQWSRDRVGILTDMFNGRGTFRVMDRHEEWATLAVGNATDFQLELNRIGVLVGDGTFMVKDHVGSRWATLVAGGVRQFQLKGGYIGVLLANGEFRVKQGITGAWTVLADAGSGIQNFQLEQYTDTQGEHTLAGALFDNGAFQVINADGGRWLNFVAGDVRQFLLKRDYFGVLKHSGEFLVKQGIAGDWHTLARAGAGPKEFQLEVYTDADSAERLRIGTLFESGTFRVRDDLDGTWFKLVDSGAQQIQLQENYIGFVAADGTLKIKEGVSGAWRSTPAYGPGVGQFRLVVDVPVPPARTTPTGDTPTIVGAAPSSYTASQQACTDDRAAGHECYPIAEDDFPVSLYGRFCGDGVPSTSEWPWAERSGPMDSLDALCLHHDMSYDNGDWYPEAEDQFRQACVVRYGIENAKLTRDGQVLAEGTSEWNAVWNRMPRLKNAVDRYVGHVSICIPANLQGFTEATAARY